MSILNTVTKILEPIKFPGISGPPEDCKPTKPDDCGDSKHSKSNDDHKDRDDYSKHAKYEDDHKGRDRDDDHKDRDHDHSKHAKYDDDHKGRDRDDDHKDRDHDHSKHAKYDDDHKGRDHDHKDGDDHSKHDGKDGDSKHADKDDCSKHAKNDDCQPHKDYCQPQRDYCDPKPSDDCGKGDTCHNPGEALAKLDFSHGGFGSQGPADHAGDMHSALASMSSDHALDYAIGQMGSADHYDVGHFDIPAETHHDAVHHA